MGAADGSVSGEIILDYLGGLVESQESLRVEEGDWTLGRRTLPRLLPLDAAGCDDEAAVRDGVCVCVRGLRMLGKGSEQVPGSPRKSTPLWHPT